MRVIWKFAVNEPHGLVEMPAGARILTAGVQTDDANVEDIFIWALVDPTAPLVEREIFVAGTGHRFTPGRKMGGVHYPIEDKDIAYVGTVFMAGGSLVFHVIDAGERP